MGSEQATSFPGRNFFKEIWAASETSQNSDISRQSQLAQVPLGWILGSAAAILVIVVGIVAYLAIKRSEEAMSNLLAEKGSSLLMVFESALRTSMRGQAGIKLQALLEEMTRSPDIEFVSVTMPDGVIIAHSDRRRLGETMKLEGEDLSAGRMAALAPAEWEKWKFTRSEGRRVFLLYRNFNLGSREWAGDVPEPVIFLGMDVSPFEITSSQNRSYVAMLSVVTMLVGLACFLALCYAQRAAESRRGQKKAEGEVHRLEKEVRRNEKLAAVGTLAAGVAHEIRNPLSSIKGYATYFSQRFPEGSDDREAATVMVNEVNRLNRVITDLLGLSRPSEVHLKRVCVENVVAHVLRLLRQNAGTRGVELSCHMARRVPDVLADMERLSQAILNLCLNALDAMPEGGRLSIAVSGGARNICIMVSDTGAGISADIIAKVFDPYFTTKGSGTGLGLAIVHKIITAHRGVIDVVSPAPPEGRGTMFRVWLRVARDDNTAA